MPSASTHRIRYRKSDKTYIPQQPWQLANKCAVCNGHFSPFRLRHHCRNCGISVCGSHSRRRVRIPSSLSSDKQRVCDACFQLVQIGNMSSVGDTSLWRTHMAKRADQGRQMQKINARETSHSSVPHRTQSAASVPPGTRPASTPSQTIGDDNVRKHGVPLVRAPEKAKGTQPEKRHRKRETKHGQHSSRPKQRSRPTDGSSVKVSRDRSGVKSEECHVDQHKKKRSKQRLADAKSVDKVARKRKSKHQPSRAGDGNNSDDADAIARRLLASKRSIAVKSLPDSPAKSEDNASCIAVGNNKKEMEDLVDTIARKEQMILQNQMEIQYFYHKWQFLQRKEDVAANEAKCATVRIRRIGKARQKASQLVASSEKLFAEEEYQASILELLRATAIEQSNAKAWNLLAQCRMKVVDYVAAEIACRKCIQYQDTPSNLVLLGQIMMCQGHPDQAIEYYQKALAVCNI